MDQIAEPRLLPDKKAKGARKGRGKGKRKKQQARASWLARATSATPAVLGVGVALGALIGTFVGRRR